MVAGAGAVGPQAGLALVNNEPQKKASDHRRSNKPIMEKRRRARINNCLNELKTLILDAMKKDPARHSKLEKADILEMTVRHLESLQRQQNAMNSATDPGVLNKFRAGYSSCAGEVGRFPGLEPNVKRRLLQHLANCLVNVTGTVTNNSGTVISNSGTVISNSGTVTNGTDCVDDTKRNEIPILPAPSTVEQKSQQKITDSQQIQLIAHQNGNIFYTNYSSDGQQHQAVQLIPTRLPNGDIALILPQKNKSNINLHSTSTQENDILNNGTENVLNHQQMNNQSTSLHQNNVNIQHLSITSKSSYTQGNSQQSVIQNINTRVPQLQSPVLCYENSSSITNNNLNTTRALQIQSPVLSYEQTNTSNYIHTKNALLDSNTIQNINSRVLRIQSPAFSYESPPTPPKSSHNGETPERLETYSPDFIQNNRVLTKKFDENGIRKPMKRTLADTLNTVQENKFDNVKVMKLNDFNVKYEQDKEYVREYVKLENESDLRCNQEPISLVVRRPYQNETEENGSCWRPW